MVLRLRGMPIRVIISLWNEWQRLPCMERMATTSLSFSCQPAAATGKRIEVYPESERNMCTRFYLELSPELRPYIEAANHSPLKAKMVSSLGREFKTEGEIRPTDMTTVIAPGRNGMPAVFPMVWGYHVKGINHPVVNARVESAKEKQTFTDDWNRHRCIVPASYYFEWEHIRRPDGKIRTGDKYSIQPRNATVTYLAGLYRIEEERGLKYPVFTVLTREPCEALARIHDRMPVILPGDAIDDWINPDADPAGIVTQALTDMVVEKAE